MGSWAGLAMGVEPFLANEASESAKHTLAALAMADEQLFGGVAAGVEDYASSRSAELVGMKWVDGQLIPNPNAEWQITDQTRDMIRNEVLRTFQEGIYPEDLAVTLEKSGAFSESRANMIARTELAFANAEGNRKSIEATGLAGELEKRSTLSSDHDAEKNPCDCDENEEAGWIPYNEEYPNGDTMYPFHPNCFCSESYRQAGSDDDDE